MVIEFTPINGTAKKNRKNMMASSQMTNISYKTKSPVIGTSTQTDMPT